MKLFQQLLVAPAAIGLLAPFSANAAEINLESISSYAPIADTAQATSALSDIHPSDWTFQALVEIRNSRGCNASIPTGVITRAEAAALLNKCLGDASTLNATELKLVDEFGPELATLKGTSEVLDSLSFEAGSFSSTTVLSGSANINLGAVEGAADEELQGNYKLAYSLTSSFSGEDALVADFEMGNAGSLGIDGESDKGATPTLTDFYYSFPLLGTQVCVGALMDGDACLAGTYVTYAGPAYNGTNDFWSENVGTGTAIAVSKSWDNGLNISGNVQGGSTGVLAAGSDNYTGQIGYDGETFGGAFTYTSFDGDDTAYGFGVYVNPEGWPSLNFGYDNLNQDTATYVDLSSYFISLESGLGDGTIGASYQSKDSGTTVATPQGSYEVYYAYPVNDNITLTPMVWIVEDNGNGGTDSTTTGVGMTVGFSF
tara:strand:+ start:25764 stop:27050 length:1287 start_codon:yes stop_codon:yes gene_type:complete